jgi:hypothetical protein
MWQGRIGQDTHLSIQDRAMMGMVYPFPNWRFVDIKAAPGGNGLTYLSPYRTFSEATSNASAGARLVIEPGTYSGAGVYSKNLVLWAPIGGVIIR